MVLVPFERISSMPSSRFLVLVFFFLTTSTTSSFSNVSPPTSFLSTAAPRSIAAAALTKLHLVDVGATSLVAGSLAGSIGIGMAFPLDTIKTKAQVLAQEERQAAALAATTAPAAVTTLPNSDGSFSLATSDAVAFDAAAAASSAAVAASSVAHTQSQNRLSLCETAALIMEREGIPGFFSGVRVVMAGEAIIKAVAFTVNTLAFSFLNEHLVGNHEFAALLGAACLSGFATAFFVVPVERVKVVMQANPRLYQNELDCIRVIHQQVGIVDFLFRGLGTTLWREVPWYGVYFLLYGLLMKNFDLGPVASPLLFGALAGAASWVPVYPADVIKTLIQNNSGGENDDMSTSAWQLALQVYQQSGIGGFFEGMTPKLLRASVNNSVAFAIYEAIMHQVAHTS